MYKIKFITYNIISYIVTYTWKKNWLKESTWAKKKTRGSQLVSVRLFGDNSDYCVISKFKCAKLSKSTGVHTIFLLWGSPMSTSRNGLVLTKKIFCQLLVCSFAFPSTPMMYFFFDFFLSVNFYTILLLCSDVSEHPLQTRHSQTALFHSGRSWASSSSLLRPRSRVLLRCFFCFF